MNIQSPKLISNNHPENTMLSSKLIGGNDRCFLRYCDAHPNKTDDQIEKNVGWGLGSVHQFLTRWRRFN